MHKNMYRCITCILSVTILLVLAFSNASAQTITEYPPEKPVCYYGAVQQDGTDFEGQVSVWTGDICLAISDTFNWEESSVYRLMTSGGNENDPVQFYLNGIPANTSIENPTYLPGDCIKIDLSLLTDFPGFTLYLPLIVK